MNYEQKYKDALDAARHIYDDMKSGGNFGGMEDLEVIFPELAESEDERIRKTLIEELSACNTVGELKFRLPAPTREECIAWLEKQKEHWKPSEEQMEALESAVKLYKDTHFEIHHEKIVSLYEQLKAL